MLGPPLPGWEPEVRQSSVCSCLVSATPSAGQKPRNTFTPLAESVQRIGSGIALRNILVFDVVVKCLYCIVFHCENAGACSACIVSMEGRFAKRREPWPLICFTSSSLLTLTFRFRTHLELI